MKIFTPEECKAMCKYDKYYGNSEKKLVFETEGKGLRFLLVDLLGEIYQHNVDRMIKKCEEVGKNFPPLKTILDQLELYFIPYPAPGFSNATCWGVEKRIVFYGRGTQIPHCMSDYIIGHELGHIVQYNIVGHHHGHELWKEYLCLRKAPRGVFECYAGYDEEKQQSKYENKEDFECFHKADKSWHETPAEWFAEDFRFLYGVDTGEDYWGLEIPPPNEEVKNFFVKIGG